MRTWNFWIKCKVQKESRRRSKWTSLLPMWSKCNSWNSTLGRSRRRQPTTHLTRVPTRRGLITPRTMIRLLQTSLKKLGETVWQPIILHMSTIPYLINTRLTSLWVAEIRSRRFKIDKASATKFILPFRPISKMTASLSLQWAPDINRIQTFIKARVISDHRSTVPAKSNPEPTTIGGKPPFQTCSHNITKIWIRRRKSTKAPRKFLVFTSPNWTRRSSLWWVDKVWRLV